MHSLQTYYNLVGQIKQYVKANRKDRGRFSVLITQVDCPFDIKTENRPLSFKTENRPLSFKTENRPLSFPESNQKDLFLNKDSENNRSEKGQGDVSLCTLDTINP